MRWVVVRRWNVGKLRRKPVEKPQVKSPVCFSTGFFCVREAREHGENQKEGNNRQLTVNVRLTR